MARADSPVEISSSPTLEDGTPNLQIQDEPGMVDSPCASPTTSVPTTANSSATPSAKCSQDKDASTASSSTSANRPSQQERQRQQQSQNSGDASVRRRQGTHSHRNSSFEYKETLDATTRHLEVSPHFLAWRERQRGLRLSVITYTFHASTTGRVAHHQSVQAT
jgi:hypothetical protein